jgi:hypothetical protein
VVRQLIGQLVGLPAAIGLPPRHSSKHLAGGLFILGPRISLGIVNVEATAAPPERVTKQASDHDIWCAVCDAVTPTAPGTPRVSALPSTQSSIPMTTNSGSDMDTGSMRKIIDPKLLAEPQGHLWVVNDSFFDQFFPRSFGCVVLRLILEPF